MNNRNVVLLSVISALAYTGLGYFVVRTNFQSLLFCFMVLFGGYALLIKHAPPLKTLVIMAVVFRFVLLLSTPALSDDYFRFVWDGRLLVAGINPYLVLPSVFVQTLPAQSLHVAELFPQLNSPQYYSVYPPLNQFVFALSARLSGGSLWANIVLIRLILMVVEAACCWALLKLKFPVHNFLLLYGLNPLVIVELTGNLHFEGMMVGFLVLAFALLHRQKLGLSAVFMALAVATKLLPLVFIPLVAHQIGWRKATAYSAIVGGINLALFGLFFDAALVQNIASSIDLYFQKFEFNASLYYLVRQIGYWLYGYNTIAKVGVMLSMLAFGGILFVSFFSKQLSFYQKALFVFAIYLACATTVHPWYVATLVAVSSLTTFRFPMVWTLLLPLTYAAYATQPYAENLWLVAIEYSVVGFVVWKEFSAHSKNKLPSALSDK